MTLLETLALLTFMLGLLSLIVDVVRLTLEVMDKFSQKKNDDSKKDRLPQRTKPDSQSFLILGKES